MMWADHHLLLLQYKGIGLHYSKIIERKLLIFSYPSVLTYVLGAQKNCSFEYQQHMFWLKSKKIVFFITTKGLIRGI